MGKNRQKKQNYSQTRENRHDWIVKPLSEQQNHKKEVPFVDDDQYHKDGVEEFESSSSTLKVSNGGNLKWVSKIGGTHVEKSDLEPKYEVDGPTYGKKGGGQEVDERESVGGERKCEEIDVCKVIEEGGGGGGGGVHDDVIRRLEELQVRVEEVGLSQEEIKTNDQAQEDELLAVESIYGQNVYVLGKTQGLRSFQIHIHVELPSEYPVSVKLKTDINANPNTGDSNNFTYSFQVQYLSPIILTCLLPKSYPSHCPPSFTISAQWLQESRISELCSMLDSLWNEQPGQEILYQWVEWLHSSSLSYLGFGEGLLLGPYSGNNNLDKRAISGSVSPDIDIPSMKHYNEKRQHENFLGGFHECCICFSEYAGTEFLRLPCHHFYCEKCIKTYADVLVKDGTVNKLQCPETKCDGMIPPGLLKRLLGDEEFERWESLLLQKTLDSMSDVVYCPRCETACLEDGDNDAQCSKCLFSFCSLCRGPRHVGIACMTPEEKLKLLEERQSSSNLKDGQRRKELDMINELRSVREILKDAKQCPSCKIAISRTEGCNKMVCSQCGQFFCYRCSKAIDGYDHFSQSGCELFPQEAIVQWEERMNPRQVFGQIQAELFAANARACPSCRQPNVKVGNNNHIFCWACQNHYCFLCRKIVRRSKEHFGPKGCKQHSVG